MNVPKLRFKEFNDEWAKNYVGNVAGIYLGVTYTPDYVKSGKIFISSKDISKGYLDLNDIKYISEDEYNKISTNAKPVKGDVLFTRVGSNLGNPTVIETNLPLTIFVSLGYLRVNKNLLDNYFIKYWMESNYFWQQVDSKVAGGAKQNLNIGWLSKFEIKFPKIVEQKKIANTLELLDKKIELQTKKIEDLKLFKTGLFNIIKNLMCESEYLLKDIVTFGNGKGHENIVDENGNYVLINSKFISTEGTVIKKCTEQLCPLKENDIVMVMSDLPNGKALAKCFYVDENDKYSLNQRICLLRANNNINPQYLFYKINRNPYYLKFDDGVNQTNLKKEDILNLVINLPNIEYQNKYSQIMISIDKKIKNEKTYLTKLFKLKKGLMQNLFV